MNYVYILAVLSLSCMSAVFAQMGVTWYGPKETTYSGTSISPTKEDCENQHKKRYCTGKNICLCIETKDLGSSPGASEE